MVDSVSPLEFDEIRAFLVRLEPLAKDRQLILVGGQAPAGFGAGRPRFGRLLLDAGEPEKLVRTLNERVFELAFYDARSHRLMNEFCVDVFDAVIEDRRLDPKHLAVRIPQMRELVATANRRWELFYGAL